MCVAGNWQNLWAFAIFPLFFSLSRSDDWTAGCQRGGCWQLFVVIAPRPSSIALSLMLMFPQTRFSGVFHRAVYISLYSFPVKGDILVWILGSQWYAGRCVSSARWVQVQCCCVVPSPPFYRPFRERSYYLYPSSVRLFGVPGQPGDIFVQSVSNLHFSEWILTWVYAVILWPNKSRSHVVGIGSYKVKLRFGVSG